MKTLREYVDEFAKEKKAIGHFNFSNLEGFWAIVRAAQNLNLPVILGTSEGERDAIGVNQAVALVKSVRNESGLPIFLNADHHYSVEAVKSAIDAGYDSVIFDGAKLTLEENISKTKECVEYARTCGRDVLVEAELGYIGQGSNILNSIPEGVSLDNLTKPEDAKKLIEESGANMLAPAVGNIHGMFKGGVDPRLNIERIKEIKDFVGVPIVLHGGSGNDEDFEEAIKAGMAIVHVNTELRATYTKALKLSLQENPEETTPYKYGKEASFAMQKVVEEKMKKFARL